MENKKTIDTFYNFDILETWSIGYAKFAVKNLRYFHIQ